MSAFLKTCGGLGMLCLVLPGCSGRVDHEHWHLRTWGDLRIDFRTISGELTRPVNVDVVLLYDDALAKKLADETEPWFEYPDPDDPEASKPGYGERFCRENRTRLQRLQRQWRPGQPVGVEKMGYTERAVTGWVFAASRDPDFYETKPWQDRTEFDPRKDIRVEFVQTPSLGGGHVNVTPVSEPSEDADQK